MISLNATTNNLSLSEIIEIRKNRSFEFVYSSHGITRLSNFTGSKITDASNFDVSGYTNLFNYYVDNSMDLSNITLNFDDFSDLDDIKIDDTKSLLDDNNELHRKIKKEQSLMTLNTIKSLETQASLREEQELETARLLEIQKQEELNKIELLKRKKELEAERIAKEQQMEAEKIELEHQQQVELLEKQREEERLQLEKQKQEELLKMEEEKRLQAEREAILESERLLKEKEEEHKRELEKLRLQAELEIKQKEQEIKLKEIEEEKERKIREMSRKSKSSLNKYNDTELLTADIMMEDDYPFELPIFSEFLSASDYNSREFKLSRNKNNSGSSKRLVYSVCSTQKQSFGTTVAYNLASNLTKTSNKPVLLIDLDFENAEMSYRFKLKNCIQTVFSNDFNSFLFDIGNNVDKINFGNVTFDVIGSKSFYRMNETYRSQLASYDFNDMIYNFGRVYPIIVLDLGVINPNNKYQYKIMNSDFIRSMICVNSSNSTTLTNGFELLSNIKQNVDLILCNSKKKINEQLLSKRVKRSILGVLGTTSVLGNPNYNLITDKNIKTNWESIFSKIRR